MTGNPDGVKRNRRNRKLARKHHGNENAPLVPKGGCAVVALAILAGIAVAWGTVENWGRVIG